MKFNKINLTKKNLFIIGIVAIAFIGGIILLAKGGSNGKGILYNPDKNIKIVK